MTDPGKSKRKKRQGKQAAARAPDPSTFVEHRFDTLEASRLFYRWHYDDPGYQGNGAHDIAMPPHDCPVSATPHSGGMVYRVFPDGLVYGDQRWSLAGMGLFMLAMLVFISSVQMMLGAAYPFQFFASLMSEGGTLTFALMLFLALVMLAVSPLIVLAILDDLIDFRFETSALFDRKAAKVHLFSRDLTRRRPWSYRVDTYDWACVRAGIGQVSIMDEKISSYSSGMVCLVMDGPGGTRVVDRFVLRAITCEQPVQSLLDIWEHVRCFMQYEGPVFAAGDGPNFALGRKPLWKHLWTLPEQHLALTAGNLKDGWREKNPLYLFPALLGLISMPAQLLVMWWGVLPWISGLAKLAPVWPCAALASVGGKAWRHAAPRACHQDGKGPGTDQA